jgi:hypothetical protein
MKLYILLYKIVIYFTLYCSIKGYDKFNDEYNISKLQMKLLKLSNSAKYILATLDDSIDLRKKNNQAITDMLNSSGFATIDGDYAYLFHMTMDSVTEENVNRILKEKEDVEIKLNYLMLQKKTYGAKNMSEYFYTGYKSLLDNNETTSDPIVLPTFAPSVDPNSFFNCPHYSVTNTDNAVQNYATCLVYACPGTSLVVSGCGSDDGCNGDQFFRLYDSSNNQVAYNDDACNSCSEIRYALSQPCQTYSISEGCYNSGSCGGTLLVTGGISGTYQPTSEPTYPPTIEPTMTPTAPTAEPTALPTAPTPTPTATPTFEPSVIPTASPTFAPITLHVNSIIDSYSNISLCYPIIYTTSCNLRSAWDVCNTYPSELCTIVLPFNEILQMTKLGDLFLNSNTKSIEIIGNNSIIIGEEQVTTFDTLTIPGFPVENLQLTNTNNAQQNYFEGFVHACSNDIIVFSSCDSEDTNQDTYYRLFDSNGDQIASNDDSCGFSSEIEYEVSSQSQCQNYSIHVGCYGSSSCATSVSGTLITNINNVYMPRLITYDDYYNILSPNLKISSCTIENFGNIELDGGAISINGSLNLELNNVKFNKNTGYNGGSIYLSNLIQPVINNCTFNEIVAINNGGAIYVDTSVTGFIMNNSIFTSCSSLYNGGSLYFNYHNSDVLISKTLFLSNFAENKGGSIYIYANSSDITIIDCAFRNSQAQYGAGNKFLICFNLLV